jgi:mRNA interferase MazF
MSYEPKQGDIILLEFDPQAGHEQKGKRPALIISNNTYNL